MRKDRLVLAAIVAVIVAVSCNKEVETFSCAPIAQDTSVRFELAELPYGKLSDYRFFVGELKAFQPNTRVLPYEPITPLFSDYAHKSRFVWMPEGVSAAYVSDGEILNFPNGAVMIKHFYYDNVQPQGERKIIETRLIYKKNDVWEFADYTWNEEQTEATYSLEGSYAPVEWIDENGVTKSVDFRLPSEVECVTCHKQSNQPIPIGPKPQNLNKTLDYADGTMNQLSKWQEVGYLSGNVPSEIVTTVAWDDASKPIDLRVRSYIDANCAHCHSELGHCYYRPLRFPFSETGMEQNLGVCEEPEEFINESLTHIVARGNINRSVMHFRLNTTSQQYRMPLLGRTIIHEEGVAMISEYINSLTPNCE